VAKFSKSGVSGKVLDGSALIFDDTQIFWYHIVALVEESLHAKNQLFSRFDTIPTCDGQRDGHKAIAYTALVKWYTIL